MKNVYGFMALCLGLALLFSSCSEDSQTPDTTPPAVAITAPVNNAEVSEIVRIEVQATDDESVETVWILVDGDTLDNVTQSASEQYAALWNTVGFEDGVPHQISALAEDCNGNCSDTVSVSVNLNQEGALPQLPVVTSICFESGNVRIEWDESPDSDFGSYRVYQSENSDMSSPVEVARIVDRSLTKYAILDVPFNKVYYFQLVVSDTLGLSSQGPAHVVCTDLTVDSYRLYPTEDLHEISQIVFYSDEAEYIDHVVLTLDGNEIDSLSATEQPYTFVLNTVPFDDGSYELGAVIYDIRGGQCQRVVSSVEVNNAAYRPATPVFGLSTYYWDEVEVAWEICDAGDFSQYLLFMADDFSMADSSLVFSCSDKTDTRYMIQNMQPGDRKYLMLRTVDIFGLYADSDVLEVYIDPEDENRKNYALSFDGNNDVVEIRDTDSRLDNTRAGITLMARVQIQSFPNVCPYIIERTDSNVGSGNGDRYILGLLQESRGFQINVDSNVLTCGNLQTGVWYDLTATFDNSYMRLFLNGEWVGSRYLSGHVVDVVSTLRLGNSEGLIRGFHGLMDNVSIWNRALTSNEVQFYSGRTLDGNENGLAAYYDMNEGTGQILMDKAGSNHGILGRSGSADYGDPQWVPVFIPYQK